MFRNLIFHHHQKMVCFKFTLVIHFLVTVFLRMANGACLELLILLLMLTQKLQSFKDINGMTSMALL